MLSFARARGAGYMKAKECKLGAQDGIQARFVERIGFMSWTKVKDACTSSLPDRRGNSSWA